MKDRITNASAASASTGGPSWIIWGPIMGLGLLVLVFVGAFMLGGRSND